MNKLKNLTQSEKNHILYIFLGILVCVSFLFALHAWENRHYRMEVPEEEMRSDIGQDVIFLDGKRYEERDQLETVLLIGLDKFDYQTEDRSDTFSNNQQSDFLMLLIIDKETGRYIPLHINRDSMAPVQLLGLGGRVVGTKQLQLALSHTYGSGGVDSCRNTVKAVSDFLYGIHIDRYVSFSRDAVAVMNDTVGGVPVKIVDDFSAVDPALEQGKTVRLEGEQALTYVSARGSMQDSSNLARMERQRQYLISLREQAYRCMDEDPDFVAKTVAKLSEYMTSNCSMNQLSGLIDDTREYQMAEIETIPGKAVKGEEFMEFYPDEQAMKELIVSIFFEQKDE